MLNPTPPTPESSSDYIDGNLKKKIAQGFPRTKTMEIQKVIVRRTLTTPKGPKYLQINATTWPETSWVKASTEVVCMATMSSSDWGLQN